MTNTHRAREVNTRRRHAALVATLLVALIAGAVLPGCSSNTSSSPSTDTRQGKAPDPAASSVYAPGGITSKRDKANAAVDQLNEKTTQDFSAP